MARSLASYLVEGGPLVAVVLSWAWLAWVIAGWGREDLALAWERARSLGEAAGRALEAAVRAHAGRWSRGADRVGSGEVAEMVDVVSLGLSAGLSFDAALAIYCEQRDASLSRSLAQARMSWQMGIADREEALMGVARKADSRALESFAAAVGRALALGAPLAEVLAAQAGECRAAHRAEVERAIERAPVKLLIPTGTLILPALLLSIVGPLLAAGGMM